MEQAARDLEKIIQINQTALGQAKEVARGLTPGGCTRGLGKCTTGNGSICGHHLSDSLPTDSYPTNFPARFTYLDPIVSYRP